ncbi:HAD domain-containing protein [Streptomyces sp. NBC_00637]|uniref:HAD domain-containing protein n=1 Tax=Streptomyces sp. NBC_00637 TaxID=2903667 RepID=UPI00324B0E9C
MTSAVRRPLLFLDVDGPLIPFGASADHPRTAPAGASTPVAQGNPLLERLDPGVGARLMALGCRLVWATTWMDRANEVVAPRIGLPKLPVAQWPDAHADTGIDTDADTGAEKLPHGLHWKTRHLVEWAGGRPFIWVDDEISSMDRLWVAAQHPGPSLLHRVDPARGLDDADFAAITDWLRTVAPE